MAYTNNNGFNLNVATLRQSPYVQQNNFGAGPVPPPSYCFLGIQVTSGILAIQVTSGFLQIHCPSEVFALVDYRGNRYANYVGDQYIEIQSN